MLRRLWAGSRAPAHNLTSSLCRSPQQFLFRQVHFSPRSRILRHGPQNNHHHHHQWGKSSRQLHARIYGSVYTSIGFLVLNEALDWEVRRNLGIETVQNITLEADSARKWRKFYETGESLLAAYSGAEVEHHEGAIRFREEAGWGDELETRVLTAPDPEVEGGTLVLCLSVLRDPEEEIYFSEHGNRLTDATMTVLPEVEAFARALPASPKVRGAMILLQQDGDWKSLYYDGTRWINIVYLEWQTAESMGLPSAHEVE
ncbi:hypothetical protein F5Y19DRAFT_447692 [Xylariaceae sp. FL1651]|nr:hypothetical protein F5Y19DRAFT_447692 [Xylariaceae sp. FL1651]